MKSLIPLVTAVVLLSGCGSAPTRPESLWDSIPDAPGEGTAKTVPAKIWSEEDSTDAAVEGPAEPEVEGTVVLNEIYYDAVGADTDGVLFVELYGTPGLSLSRFRVQFVDGGDGSEDDAITLPEAARIAEDGYFLIADALTGQSGVTSVPDADLIDNFDPQNGPDAVQLLAATGDLLDVVGYGEGLAPVSEGGWPLCEGTPAPDVLNGHSLERLEPGRDSGDNAADFIENESPTPGY